MYPRQPRRAFSLVEILTVMAALVLLAGAAFLSLGGESLNAERVAAKNQLQRMRDEIQARAMTVPGYHFETLEAALGLSAPPEDPWGQPYMLLHQSPRTSAGFMVTLQAGGDAGFGGSGVGCARTLSPPHLLFSFGPPDGSGQSPMDAERELGDEDLFVLLKLGTPPGRGGTPASPLTSGSVVLPGGAATLRVWDHEAVDGDRIRISLDGALLAADVALVGPPGRAFPVTLTTGNHTLVVEGIAGGSVPPASPALRLDGGQTWTPLVSQGERFQVILTAP